MNFFEFKKIRSRLVFWFLLTSFIPLLVSMVVFYISRQRINDLNAFEKLVSIRDLKVAQVNKWLDERTGDINLLAGTDEIRELAAVWQNEMKPGGSNEKINIATGLLKRSLTYYNDYESIFIIDSNTGQVLVSTHEELKGKDKSQELFFTRAIQKNELYISPIVRSKTTHEPEMNFSIPVYGLENTSEPFGILVAQINLNVSLYSLLLNRVGLGETGETLIVDQETVALNELRWYGNAALRLEITANPAVYAAQGKSGTIKTADYRNVKVLAAYTFIPRTGWGLICKQDKKELNATLKKTAVGFLFILLLAGTIIVIITLRFSHSISNPIVQMNEIAQKIRLGDFSQRNKIHSIDELGMLELEFNNMADEIESRIRIQNHIHKISATMLKQNEMKEFSMNLLKRLLKSSKANIGVFYILNEIQSVYEPYSSFGTREETLSGFDALIPPEEIAPAVFSQKINHIRDISEKTAVPHNINDGPLETVAIPVVVERIVVAVILLIKTGKFGKESIQVLEQSHAGINTSYSNILASERTRILSEQLTIINRQLEEQTEELQKQNVLLEVQRKQVEEANKLKSEFLSNMSHELRTPLNSIMALSKVLLQQAQTKLDDDESNYLEIIERNGRRLLAIINDILDLSKIEAGKMDVVAQKVSVVSLLHAAAESLHTLAGEKKLQLAVKIPEPLPTVVTDEFRLHQVLVNIIGNAIKFTEKGGVVISATHHQEYINISVKDTGIGISKEMQEYIFDEFRQADGSISRQYQGTGLGLAIARKIMVILGGSISVKSKPGEGSEFTIHLPIHKNTVDRMEIEPASAETGLEKNTKVYSRSEDANNLEKNQYVNKKREFEILIIEDDADNLVTLRALLEDEYFLSEAPGNDEALKMMQSRKPDLILMGMSIQYIERTPFLEQVRKKKEYKNVPVIAVTAQAMKGDREKFLNLGFDGYVAKPIEAADLKKEIKRLMT
ncbi:MAG: response regulator [Prolixibacteraceae bacterium]|nr:response regulator [Prolixibacteraceae bacterium]